MKREGLVIDQWVWFASNPLPRIKAHTFHITDRGRRELEFLQSLGEPPKTCPLGYCILKCLKDAYPATAGQIAKMCDKDRGHVRRVLTGLENHGLVRRYATCTRTRWNSETITNLWEIAKVGEAVLDAGPVASVRAIRRRDRSRLKF